VADAARRCCPVHDLDPDSTGGAMLLGVDGVHHQPRSSSATAIVNAPGGQRDGRGRLVERLRAAVAPLSDPAPSQAHKVWPRYTARRSVRPGVAERPAETHVERSPMDRQQVFDLIHAADILEVERRPSTRATRSPTTSTPTRWPSSSWPRHWRKSS
jgi:hypothetical protein